VGAAPGERALNVFIELTSLEGDADLKVTHRALGGDLKETGHVVTNVRLRLAAAEVPPGEPVVALPCTSCTSRRCRQARRLPVWT
jgi:hypothetical protein